MAQCRKAEETEFIEAVAFGLFEVVTKWLDIVFKEFSNLLWISNLLNILINENKILNQKTVVKMFHSNFFREQFLKKKLFWLKFKYTGLLRKYLAFYHKCRYV